MKKDYSEWDKSDLIKEIKQLKKRKKFGLVWEDKPEEVAEMCKVQLPVLEDVPSKEIVSDKDQPTNFIIEGDNYHALSVLNYTHKDQIDVIYADPPYNTGNSTWIYNNNIVDSNDTYRHSKWLSFMQKRLVLAKNLLKSTGLIAITIDDYELFTLGLLMDEIFGEQNRVGVLAVENNPRGRTANRFYATSHEYYLVYAKNHKLAKINNLLLTEEQKAAFKFEDEISAYRLRPLRKSGASSRRKDRPKQFFPIYINPKTLEGSLLKKNGWVKMLPIDNTSAERVWSLGRETCDRFLSDGTIIIKPSKTNKFSLFFKDRIKTGRKPRTVWVDPRYDTSSHGATLLLNMFGEKVFDYPKSIWAVRDFIYTAVGENKKAIILDFFAGSGTTGHAVLELNKEDKGQRQFILCTNNENEIAENVTYPRVAKAINGYRYRNKVIQGIPANLKYFKTKSVNKVVTDADRRNFVNHASEMLCLAEGTFESVIEKKSKYSIFSNGNKATGIIYDEDYISDAKKELKKIDKKLVIYVFSYDNSYNEEDFEDMPDSVVKPIPAVILNVYQRIIRQGAKKINI